MHRASYRDKVVSFKFSECVTLPESPRVHQPESSSNSVLLGFHGGFIIWA